MHLPQEAFTVNGLPTIEPLKEGVNINNLLQPDVGDYFHINLLYCGGE